MWRGAFSPFRLKLKHPFYAIDLPYRYTCNRLIHIVDVNDYGLKRFGVATLSIRNTEISIGLGNTLRIVNSSFTPLLVTKSRYLL